jgi:YidC/Oxa1 family membrane protein insertase
MKNKNNIFIIAGIILFIILYQVYVLSPHQEQLRQWQEYQKSLQNGSTTPESIPNTADNTREASTPRAQTSSGSGAQQEATGFVELKERQLIRDLTIGEKRELKVFEGAYLGRALLRDYFDRDLSTKKPVELNARGLYWSSTHNGIQSCLNSLTQNSVVGERADALTMRAQVAGGICEFSLLPSEQHVGLVLMTLVLDGFEASDQDVLVLQGSGVIGDSNALNQNYLSYKVDDSINNIKDKDLFNVQSIRGRMNWATWGDRYFSFIFKPQGLYNPDLSFRSSSNNPSAMAVENVEIQFSFQYPARPERAKTRFEYVSEVYFGTRDTTMLNAIDPQLVETVELGFFASVARLMLWSLKALNTFFGNFGVSIIALTLLVRLVFWPLNKKAYMSTIKMKELQPEMDRIRKKYDSKDRSQAEKMNREIFDLYRKRKINPLGGCLPLLLQLPIFIGLYGALSNSVDLYQAPFFGWITDLSLPDPFFILSILWTLSLLAYLKINPQAMNTNQPGMPNMKWIMIVMNVVFGFLSKDWPSGLVLYLLVSNCVGLLQQFFLLRSSNKTQLVKEGA